MRIYVVRHGLTELNKKHLVNGWIDEPLVEEGRQQAEQLKNKLPSDIKAIYTSPLIRAKQTADIIGQRFHIPAIVCEELKEVNWGTLAGKSFDDMEKENGYEYGKENYTQLKYDYRPFGGESIGEVRERIQKLITQVKRSHQAGPILFVTHGGILRILEHDYNQKLIEDMVNGHIVEFEL